MSKSTKNSSKTERHYGLTAEEVTELKAQFAESKTMPNPHRSGAYKFTIDALLNLGSNQPHPLAEVHEAFKQAAGEEWYKTWAAKKGDHDADARFLQNLGVLQRTADYGRKLLEVGQKIMETKGVVIDLTRDDKGELLVALNTDSAKPLKPGRATKAGVVASKPQAKPKAKAKGKGKGNGPKKATKKPRKASQKKAAKAK
jgi:hypothetical protein